MISLVCQILLPCSNADKTITFILKRIELLYYSFIMTKLAVCILIERLERKFVLPLQSYLSELQKAILKGCYKSEKDKMRVAASRLFIIHSYTFQPQILILVVQSRELKKMFNRKAESYPF